MLKKGDPRVSPGVSCVSLGASGRLWMSLGLHLVSEIEGILGKTINSLPKPKKCLRKKAPQSVSGCILCVSGCLWMSLGLHLVLEIKGILRKTMNLLHKLTKMLRKTLNYAK